MPRPGPFRREFAIPLHALRGELNRLFDEYWVAGRYPGSGAPTSPGDIEPSSWSPAVDLVETADAYVVTAEVPGIDPATIDLSVTGNVLSLRGSKPAEEAKGEPGHPRERVFGPFHRQVVLPGEVDFDGAEAESRLGVITVRVPKRAATKPRTIPVQAL